MQTVLKYVLSKSSLALLLALAVGATLNVVASDSNAVSCGKKLENRPSALIGDGNEMPCRDDEGAEWRCYDKYWYTPAHQSCASDVGARKCSQVTKTKSTYHEGVCGRQYAICKYGEEVDPPVGMQFYYYPAELFNCTGEEGQTPAKNCDEP